MLDESKRELRIGGSEIAAVFDRHEFLDQFGLWVRKKGGIPREDWEANARMRLGKHLEQGITSYAAEIMKWKYQWCDMTIRSAEYPYMVSTPDALMPDIRWGIDAKLVGWDQSHRWGKTVERIPDHVVMQAWWYMAALDYEGWYIAVLVMGEDQPRIYTVRRDPEVERVMLRRAEAWWKRYLIGDERPLVTQSQQSDRWLKHKYPKNSRPAISWATDDEVEILGEYAEVRRNYNCFNKRCQDLEARIKAVIGDRTGLEWPGGRITWKAAKDSEHVAWKELAAVLLERHPAGSQLLTEFTTTKAGSRRFLFKSSDGEEEEL